MDKGEEKLWHTNAALNDRIRALRKTLDALSTGHGSAGHVARKATAALVEDTAAELIAERWAEFAYADNR